MKKLISPVKESCLRLAFFAHVCKMFGGGNLCCKGHVVR